ncbi:MAG: T9SS type A sorting domain-containing protein [Chitinophagales bacterium]|nr:T9SS type A sorting domain-containing protein [Chitinophagales bacterium]
MRKVTFTFLSILFCTLSWAQPDYCWQQRADFAGMGREHAVSFTHNGIGYIGLGRTPPGAALGYFTDFWGYRPNEDAWFYLTSFPGEPCFGAFAFVIEDKLYVGGGWTNELWGAEFINELWEYDFNTNAWILKGEIPGGGRFNATAFAIAGLGYMGLGSSVTGWDSVDSTAFYSYSPSENEWTMIAPFPGPPREGARGGVVDGKAYLGTGETLGFPDFFGIAPDWYKYDPVLDEWTALADHPTGRMHNTVFVHDGSLYGYGGISVGSVSLEGNCFRYDVGLDAWEEILSLESTGWLAESFTIGNRAFLATGIGDTGREVWEWADCSVSSISNEEIIERPHVFPNPAKDHLRVFSASKGSYRLMNINGEALQIGRLAKGNNMLNIAHLPKGLYMLRIQIEDRLFLEKIIAQ